MLKRTKSRWSAKPSPLAAAAAEGKGGDDAAAVSFARIIFLDIDGVLLPFGRPDLAEITSSQSFPQCSLDALNKIVEETGATIVLSSTWRCLPGGPEHILEEFKRKLPPDSALAKLESFAAVTALGDHTGRQNECVGWLRSNKTELGVQNWVMIDDDGAIVHADRYKEYCVGHAVLTESDVGLTAEGAAAAIACLTAPPDERPVPQHTVLFKQKKKQKPAKSAKEGKGGSGRSGGRGNGKAEAGKKKE